jgi:response regulator RpfG family c-di-GMP phosphodiesterase
MSYLSDIAYDGLSKSYLLRLQKWSSRNQSADCSSSLVSTIKWEAAMCSQILALIEADEQAKEVIKSLKRLGHKVVACTSYTEAIRLIECSQFALVISDVHLENGGNVFDFLRWVRRNRSSRETPFVLYSCKPTLRAKYLEDGIRCAARLLGATRYVSMDNFDTNEFRRLINTVCPPVHKPSPGHHEKKILRALDKHRAIRCINAH